MKRQDFIATMQKVHKLGLVLPLLDWTNIMVSQPLTGQTTLDFDLKETNANFNAVEHKLNEKDTFFPVLMAIGVRKFDPETGQPLQVGNHQYLPYPDRGYFDGDGEADALEAIFNGRLDMKFETKTVLKDKLTHTFRTVPAVQADITEGILPNLGPHDADRGYRPIYLDVAMNGFETNAIVLKLLSTSNMTAINGANNAAIGPAYRNEIVIDLYGFNYRNETLTGSTDGCLVAPR